MSAPPPVAAGDPDHVKHRLLRERLPAGLRRPEWGLVLAVVAVLLITTVLDRQHNYWYNPRASAVEIFRQTALLGIFSLGAAVVIIAGGIDLSAGSMIAFSGSVCASLMVMLAPDAMKQGTVGAGVISLAIVGTVVVGFLIGSLHAWLITVIGLPPFVATLATLVGLRSLGRAMVGAVTAAFFTTGKTSQIDVSAKTFHDLSASVWIPVAVFAVLAALVWGLMSRTVTGRHLHALGGNEQAARLSGIQTDRLKWLAYCLSAVLSSIAGVLYVSYEGGAYPEATGRGYELYAIAAAVVGGCSLQGGVGTIPGTVLGALFLRVVIDCVAKLIKTGADVYEGLIVGIVVVVAVAFTQFYQAGRSGRRLFAGGLGLVTLVDLALLAGLLAAILGQGSQLGSLASGLASAGVVIVLLSLVRFSQSRT
jgi:ribose/xylose/arabinose/galactoside ABC-type transport system permease subunit